MAAMKNYYIEEMSTGAACGDLFDHIDDLLNFPGDEFLGMQGGLMETPYNLGGGFMIPTTPTPLQNVDQREEMLGGGDVVKNSTTVNHATDTTEECGGGKMLFEEFDIAAFKLTQLDAKFDLLSATFNHVPSARTLKRHHLVGTLQLHKRFIKAHKPSEFSILARVAKSPDSGSCSSSTSVLSAMPRSLLANEMLSTPYIPPSTVDS